MKRTKKVVFMLLVVCLIALMPTVAFAKPKKAKSKASKIYKDVSTKRIDAKSYEAIGYVKQHGGWAGLIRKGKFYPNRYMTRRDFLVTLHNLYGGRVYANIEDIVLSGQIVTSDFVCQRMVAMSEGLGYKITWQGNGDKMRRKDVARYIKIFATFHPKLAPRK